MLLLVISAEIEEHATQTLPVVLVFHFAYYAAPRPVSNQFTLIGLEVSIGVFNAALRRPLKERQLVFQLVAPGITRVATHVMMNTSAKHRMFTPPETLETPKPHRVEFCEAILCEMALVMLN